MPRFGSIQASDLPTPDWDLIYQVDLLSSPGYEDASAGDESEAQFNYDWHDPTDYLGTRRRSFRGGNIGWPKSDSNQRAVWYPYDEVSGINVNPQWPGSEQYRTALHASSRTGEHFTTGEPYEFFLKEHTEYQVWVPSSTGGPNWTTSIARTDQIISPVRSVEFGTGSIVAWDQPERRALYLLAGILPASPEFDPLFAGQLELGYDNPDYEGPHTQAHLSSNKLWRRIPWYSLVSPGGEGTLQYVWAEVPPDCFTGEIYDESGTALGLGVRARWAHSTRTPGVAASSNFGTGQDGIAGFLGYRMDRQLQWALVATANPPSGGDGSNYRPPARGTLQGNKTDSAVVWTPRG